MGGRVATALTCFDGKAWPSVARWLEQTYHALHVDLVTAPGMATWIAGGDGQSACAAAKLSVAEHGSVAVAVAGHAGCTAGPADEELLRNHIQTAMEEVASWGLGVPVVGLYVDEKNMARKIAEL